MKFWVIAVATAAWLACVAIGQAQAPAAAQMSDQAFKNVQLLKGIPVDEFMGTMGLFAAALSADCTYCHTRAGTSDPKWEEDTPRKRTARRMIQMVAAINKNNFNGRQNVTCWTCHRGGPAPLVTPSLDRMYGDPVVEPPDVLPPATSGVPTADAIFDTYIQALGGATRLAALTSYTAKGTSIPFGDVGKGFPTEIYAKAPNQLTVLVHQLEGDMARSYDGRQGFFLLPLTVIEEYPWTGAALEGAKLDAEMAFPGRIKDYLTNWRVSYPTTVNGREVNVVQGTGASGFVASFYFDKETGMLLRITRYAASALGRVPMQIDYTEYRPVAGVMLPSKWSFSWLSGRDEFTITDVQPNVAIDAAKFAKPAIVSRPVK